MSWLRPAIAVVMVVAAASAIAVARRRSSYWGVAALLTYDLAASVGREQITDRILRPAKLALAAQGMDPLAAPLPFDVRIAAHVEHGLYLGWGASLAALAVAVFLREPGRNIRAVAAPLALVAVGWCAAMGVLVLGFDALRGHRAQVVYLPAALAGLTVAIGCVVRWAWRRVSPQLEHAAAAILLALEALSVAVTFSGRLTALWPMAQVVYLVLYFVLVAIHGGALWLLSRSPR